MSGPFLMRIQPNTNTAASREPSPFASVRPLFPWLFLLVIATGAIALCFRINTVEQRSEFVAEWGYPAMVATLALFVGSLVPWAKRFWKDRPRLPLLDQFLLIGSFAFVTASSPWEFKTLMDEGVIVGVSKNMHEAREASVPTVETVAPEPENRLSGYVDKRPLLQPTLVSLLHDVRGYHPSHGILVNVAAVGLFLILAWIVGVRIAGLSGARVSVLLWVSVPLLSIRATSAGLEMVNLLGLFVMLLLGAKYVRSPSPTTLAPFILAAVLAAQARYESAIFVVPTLVICAWGWFNERRTIVSWWITPVPLLLVPYAFIRILASGPKWAWEVIERTGKAEYFSIDYLRPQLPAVAEFFLDSSNRHANAIVVVVLGVGLAPLAIRQLAAMRRAGGDPAAFAVSTVGFGAAAASLGVVMLCYYWADFRDPAAARLALVLFVPLTLSALMGVAWLAARMRIWEAVSAVTVFSIVFWTSSILGQKADDPIARDTRQWNWVATQVQKSDRVLWVMPSSVWPIVHGHDALPLEAANANPAALERLLREKKYSDVFFVETFRVILPNAEHIQTDRTRTSSAFRLETIAEFSGQPFWVQRISRLVGVNP